MILLIHLIFINLYAAHQVAEFPLLNINTKKTETLSLEKNKKNWVVLFVSSHCPCSIAHEDVIQSLAKEFPSFQFTVVNSNQDETLNDQQEHFKNFSLPVYFDAHAKLADALGATKTPHAFILNSNGDVLFSGGVDDSRLPSTAHKKFLKAALTNIQNGLQPDVKQARALGCSIKR